MAIKVEGLLIIATMDENQ